MNFHGDEFVDSQWSERTCKLFTKICEPTRLPLAPFGLLQLSTAFESVEGSVRGIHGLV